MGFLELDKINTLELFLTDRGKELMLQENGLGLADLITQFSVDDRDFDYRRTSEVWINGQSPSPYQSPTMSDPFGSTQGMVNDVGLGPPNNPCSSFPLTDTCWFDMPDVRGDRGSTIVSCNYMSAATEGMLSCTNVYVFYDVTSTDIEVAEVAKIGLDEWFSTISGTTPGYSGKIFHIPVLGENWITPSYYPWNGKLDAWDWIPQTESSDGTLKFCGDPALAGYADCAANGHSAGPEVTYTHGNPPVTVTTRKYPRPVTGLYLQNSNQGVGTGDWAGFPVLPPNAYPSDTGGRAEFWTTGCTPNTLGPAGTTISKPFVTDAPLPTSFTATTNYSSAPPTIDLIFPPTILSGQTYLSGYTVNQLLGIISQSDFHEDNTANFGVSRAQTTIITDFCKNNCCPDPLTYTGPGLFGCQECSPFDSTNTHNLNHRALLSALGSHVWTEITPGVTGGTLNIILESSIIPCEKYRGMDRNVLVISLFDENDCQIRYSNGGACMLGQKTWYDITSSTFGTTESEFLGDLNGRMPGGNCNDIATTWGTQFADRQWLGFHGGNRGTECGSSCPQIVPQGVAADWNQWDTGGAGTTSCGGCSSYCDRITMMNYPIRNIQPTVHFRYSQDLFHKTYEFYNSFRGFAYPVIDACNGSSSLFGLHLYGAIYGTTISPAQFAAKGENPTVTSCAGGTYSIITSNNPYSVIDAVMYDTPEWYEPGSTTEPYDPSQLGPDPSTWYLDKEYDAVGIAQTSPPLIGLKNWGWDFNPTVGCPGGCSAEDIKTIFTGGTLSNDLNQFITGSSATSTVATGCTECQCLPAVFLNNKGPIKVEEPPTTGCLCLPETDPPVYSPDCCPEPPVTIASLCGPHPQSPMEELPRQRGELVSETGSKLRITNIQQNKEVPSPKSPLYSGRLLPTANIKSLEPALGVSSLSKQYSTEYSIDIKVSLQQFLVEDNKVGFDVTLESVSQFGNNLIDSNGAFYWVIEPGVKRDPTTNRNITRACVPLNKSKIRSTASQSRGGRISFLRAHCNIKGDAANNFISYSSKSETTYIFCIGLGVVVNNKMFFKTKRIMIKGNENYAWGITQLT